MTATPRTSPFKFYVATLLGFIPDLVWNEDSRGPFIEYLRYLHKNGIKRIVLGGTTSQFASLTLDARLEMLRLAVKNFQGEIVYNVSACALGDVHALIREALALGVKNFILLPAFYDSGATEVRIKQFFFEAISPIKDAGGTVMLYNFPVHTNVNVTPELLSDLTRDFPDTIVGIKASGGSFEFALELQRVSSVLMGNDLDALAAFEAGMGGAICGGGGVFPLLLAIYETALNEGDMETAKKCQKLINEWVSMLRGWGQHYGYNEKAVLAVAMGAVVPGFPTWVAPPIHAVSEEHVAEIREAYLEILNKVEAL